MCVFLSKKQGLFLVSLCEDEIFFSFFFWCVILQTEPA